MVGEDAISIANGRLMATDARKPIITVPKVARLWLSRFGHTATHAFQMALGAGRMNSLI
jgi:hypothetical protein